MWMIWSHIDVFWGDEMKRKDALNLIRAEYAIHGDATTASMRAYVDSKVSYAAYNAASKAGLKLFNEGA